MSATVIGVLAAALTALVAVLIAWFRGRSTGQRETASAQQAAAGHAAVHVARADAEADRVAAEERARVARETEAAVSSPAGETEIDRLVRAREAARAAGRKP